VTRVPHLLEGESRADVLTSAINDLLTAEGPGALTIRRIAARSGISSSSIYHQMGDREHLVRVAFHRASRDRLRRLSVEARHDLVAALIPEGAEGLASAGCWLAWLEVTRVVTTIGRAVTQSRAEERYVIGAALGHGVDRQVVEGIRAMALGLVVEVCQREEPMSSEDARAILRAHLAQVAPLARGREADVGSP
jgi:AcrR family transcriptional regulator